MAARKHASVTPVHGIRVNFGEPSKQASARKAQIAREPGHRDTKPHVPLRPGTQSKEERLIPKDK